MHKPVAVASYPLYISSFISDEADKYICLQKCFHVLKPHVS